VADVGAAVGEVDQKRKQSATANRDKRLKNRPAERVSVFNSKEK
jgi:hypothetical protein